MYYNNYSDYFKKCQKNMTNCNIFYLMTQNYVIFCKFNQGNKMSIVIKHTQSLLERFENKLEIWAEKVF